MDKKNKKSLKDNKTLQLRIFIGLSVIIAIFLTYYLYTNITTFTGMRAEIGSLNTTRNAIQVADKRLDGEMDENKNGNEELATTVLNELNYVFPQNENHTLLTRTLESFSNDLNRTKDPFLISNLQYLKPNKLEDEKFMILPFTMTIHSSHDNFIKFLKYVENSGTLSDKTRLLDIQSIIINFVSPQGSQGNTSGKDEINFNVAMNSYFRLEL